MNSFLWSTSIFFRKYNFPCCVLWAPQVHTLLRPSSSDLAPLVTVFLGGIRIKNLTSPNTLSSRLFRLDQLKVSQNLPHFCWLHSLEKSNVLRIVYSWAIEFVFLFFSKTGKFSYENRKDNSSMFSVFLIVLSRS